MRHIPKLLVIFLATALPIIEAHAESAFYRRNITIMRAYDPAIDVTVPVVPPTVPTQPDGEGPFDIIVAARTPLRIGKPGNIPVTVQPLYPGENIRFQGQPSGSTIGHDSSQAYGYRLLRYNTAASGSKRMRVDVARADGSVKGYKNFDVIVYDTLGLTYPDPTIRARQNKPKAYAPTVTQVMTGSAADAAYSMPATLPGWLDLDPSGILNVSSSTAAVFPGDIVVTAKDPVDASTASWTFRGAEVKPLPEAVIPQNGYAARLGSAFSVTPTVNHLWDAAQVSWIANKTWPPNWSFNSSTGKITASTATIGSVNGIVLTATDKVDGETDNSTIFSMEVFGPLTASVTPNKYADFIGETITVTPSVTNKLWGDKGQVTWSVAPSPLPPWLSFNTSTGVITATTPVRNQLTGIVLTATDRADLKTSSTGAFEIAFNAPMTAGQFTAQTGIPSGATVTSDALKFAGFYGTRTIAVTGASLLVNGTVRTSPWTILETDSISLRMATPNSQLTETKASVMVDASGEKLKRDWSVTTLAITAGTFDPLTGINSGATVTSNDLTFDGFVGTRTIAATGATLLVNDIVQTSPSNITAGDIVTLRMKTPNTQSTTATASVTVDGTVTRTWSVKNRAITAGNFTDQDGINSGAVVTSNALTFVGFDGTREIAVNGATLLVNGTVRTSPMTIKETDAVSLRMTTSDIQLEEATASVIVDGNVTRSWTVTNRAIAAGTFTPDTAITLGTTVTSNPVTFTGFIGNRTITATGATLMVNGVATASPATIKQTDSVTLSMTASTAQSTKTNASVTVDGNVTRAWSVTTRAITAGNFAPQTSINTGATVTSNAITFEGFAGTRAVTATGGTLLVNDVVTASPASIRETDQVKLRMVATTTQLGTSTASTTLDGITKTWSVTTRVITAGSFSPTTGVASGAVVTSNAMTFADFTGTRSLTATGASLVVNGTARTSPWTISATDTVALRMTTSNIQSAAATASATLDGITRSWSVTNGTIAAGNFSPNTGISLGMTVTSSPVTFSNFVGTRTITATGATLVVNGQTRPATSTITPTDAVTLVLASSTAQSTTSNASVTVDGNVTRNWSVTTRAITAANFNNQINVWPGVAVTSNEITFTGFTGTRPISSWNGTILVNGVAKGTSTNIVETDKISLRMTSSTAQSTPMGGSVVLDGITRPWTITTGTVSQVALSISPASASEMWADGQSGTAYSGTRTFTVTNSGADTFNVSSLAFTNNTNFEQTGGTCGSPMGQNQSCTIILRAKATGTAGNSGFSNTMTLSGTGAYHGNAKSVVATMSGDSLFPVTLANSVHVKLSNITALTANGRWASNRPKRVIIPNNVVIGSNATTNPALETGTGSNNLTVVVNSGGEIQGASGAENGHGGGPAFRADAAVTLVNNGAIRGGGGSGGYGGTGANGSYSTTTTSTYTQNDPERYNRLGNGFFPWIIQGPGAGQIMAMGRSWIWDGVTIWSDNSNAVMDSIVVGGVTYRRGGQQETFNNGKQHIGFSASRSYTASTTNTTWTTTYGGGGGTGGRGRGYNVNSRSATGGGAPSGQNAGWGGNGGNGGDWGGWGAAGAQGGNGGSGGQAGGAPGASIVNGHLVSYSGGGARNN